MTKSDQSIQRAAEVMRDDFDEFHIEFKAMTRKAGDIFARRDWVEGQELSVTRLNLYLPYVARTEERVKTILKAKFADRATWRILKLKFAELVSDRRDGPIVETYFNSVLRKLFINEGLDEEIEFINFERKVLQTNPKEPIYQRFYLGSDNLETIWSRILRSYGFRFKFKDLEGDVERIANAIRTQVVERFGRLEEVDQMDMIRSVFYRNKGAYLVGKITKGNIQIPIVLPLVHFEDGVIIDGVLFSKNDISIVFSFTRSYFLVDAESPVDLIHFLRPLMKHKNLSELYASIGYNRHSKTVFLKELYRHLNVSDDKIVAAPGIKGMVMVVFTLTNFNVVFKVIRDRFGPTKNFGRQHVIDCYRLVFMHDRVGRLADAMEYEYLAFEKNRISEETLHELLVECSETCFVEGDKVIVKHLFTERKLTPLNLYLETVDEEKGREVVIDYGNAVRELAAANIFPGDLLLKNFGVTRHGRVVFYDYDELCFLDQINFRTIPPPRNPEQMYSGEAWYSAEENDVFPEEFAAFMVPRGPLKDAFMEHHADLFTAKFWKGMQEQHKLGQLVDFFPYKRGKVKLGFSMQ
ncbi:MAG: bifunctional isocitrate dehydrogenase kinase/phosphatase [Flavobacteriales bacterium]|nr:bifunctional isocitrate dehydrogenase kinase/phosphatase [Flavobacteriales bacterium]